MTAAPTSLLSSNSVSYKWLLPKMLPPRSSPIAATSKYCFPGGEHASPALAFFLNNWEVLQKKQAS